MNPRTFLVPILLVLFLAATTCVDPAFAGRPRQAGEPSVCEPWVACQATPRLCAGYGGVNGFETRIGTSAYGECQNGYVFEAHPPIGSCNPATGECRRIGGACTVDQDCQGVNGGLSGEDTCAYGYDGWAVTDLFLCDIAYDVCSGHGGPLSQWGTFEWGGAGWCADGHRFEVLAPQE